MSLAAGLLALQYSNWLDGLLACWVLALWFQFCFVDSSVEMGAGSLVSGCQFSKHLLISEAEYGSHVLVVQTVIWEGLCLLLGTLGRWLERSWFLALLGNRITIIFRWFQLGEAPWVVGLMAPGS